jgi:hypothetical protein
VPLKGVWGNEPFGSRSEPDIHAPASNLCRSSGEIPKGRAEFVLSLCAYARQRTLEPVLEPGVTPTPVLLKPIYPETWPSPLVLDRDHSEEILLSQIDN